MAFSVFEDSPTRPTGSAFTFRSQTSLSINSAATTPNVDKENVNPLTCINSATRASKKSKRKYAREEGAGPLSMKKKVKTAIIGTGSSPVKNAGRKRRALGGVSNTLAPRPLAREETLVLDDLVDAANRRAVELTVSPLADASEAYLSMPSQSASTSLSSRDISPTNSAYMEVSTTLIFLFNLSYSTYIISRMIASISQISQTSQATSLVHKVPKPTHSPTQNFHLSCNRTRWKIR
jgi:hypothetical protein